MPSLSFAPPSAQYGGIAEAKNNGDRVDAVGIFATWDAVSFARPPNPAAKLLQDPTELWKVFRTSIKEAAPTLVSAGAPMLALEALHRIIRAGPIPEDIQVVLKHIPVYIDAAYTTNAAVDESLAAALMQSGDAHEVAQHLVDDLQNKINKYRGDFHYRVARRLLFDTIAQEGDLIGFLDNPSAGIEYIMTSFVKHAIPHFHIGGIDLSERHLLEKAVFSTGPASNIVPVLLIGALNDDLPGSDITARVHQLGIEHNCTFPTASDYFYDGDQFRALVAIAKMEHCLLSLNDTGVWHVLAGYGSYPYYWNEVAVSALTHSRSMYATYLRNYAIEAQNPPSMDEDLFDYDASEPSSQAIAVLMDDTQFEQSDDINGDGIDWNDVFKHAHDYVNEVAVHGSKAFEDDFAVEDDADIEPMTMWNTEETSSPWAIAVNTWDTTGAEEHADWPDVTDAWDAAGAWPDVTEGPDPSHADETSGWPDVVDSWDTHLEQHADWPDVTNDINSTWETAHTTQNDSWSGEAPSATASWDSAPVKHHGFNDHGFGSSENYEDNFWSGPQPAAYWRETDDSWAAGDKTWEDNFMVHGHPASDWTAADDVWAGNGKSFEDNLVVTEAAELSWDSPPTEAADVSTSWDDRTQVMDDNGDAKDPWDNTTAWDNGVAPTDTTSDEGYHSSWDNNNNGMVTKDFAADNGDTSWDGETAVASSQSGSGWGNGNGGDHGDAVDWNVTVVKPRVHFTDDEYVGMKAHGEIDFGGLVGGRRASVM